MRKTAYMLATVVVLYEIFSQMYILLNKETISLSQYWLIGFSLIGVIGLIGFLIGMFGGEKLSHIIALNIFVVVLINIIGIIFSPAILTEDVKNRLLEEAKNKNIELSLGNNIGNFISGTMLLSIIVSIMAFLGYSIRKNFFQK